MNDEDREEKKDVAVIKWDEGRRDQIKKGSRGGHHHYVTDILQSNFPLLSALQRGHNGVLNPYQHTEVFIERPWERLRC